MADWDDDDDELEDDDDDGQDDDGDWSLASPDEQESDTPEIPQTWDDWWDFDWESYDGDYEEYAVSADYEG